LSSHGGRATGARATFRLTERYHSRQGKPASKARRSETDCSLAYWAQAHPAAQSMASMSLVQQPQQLATPRDCCSSSKEVASDSEIARWTWSSVTAAQLQ